MSPCPVCWHPTHTPRIQPHHCTVLTPSKHSESPSKRLCTLVCSLAPARGTVHPQYRQFSPGGRCVSATLWGLVSCVGIPPSLPTPTVASHLPLRAVVLIRSSLCPALVSSYPTCPGCIGRLGPPTVTAINVESSRHGGHSNPRYSPSRSSSHSVVSVPHFSPLLALAVTQHSPTQGSQTGGDGTLGTPNTPQVHSL